MTPRFSTVTLGIVLTIAAVIFYAAIVLYGAWIDGRRQKIRKKNEAGPTRRPNDKTGKENER